MPQGSTDYTRLQDLLAAGKWKEADQETGRLMLVIAKRESWLRFEDIDDFPCTDLRIIDRLWVKSSNGHFGFSIQRRIYQSLGGTKEYKAEIAKEYNADIWGAFANAVGWRRGDWNWLHYPNMTFDLTAPEGHLPCISCDINRGDVWLGGSFWVRIQV